MGLLIDSSVFVDLERSGRPLSALRDLLPADDRLAVAALTVSELLVGIYLGTPGRQAARQEFIDAIVHNLPVIDFDVLVARRHAEVWAELHRAGQLISRHDLIISATALAHDLAVLTYNIRDFARVPGLEVRRPQTP